MNPLEQWANLIKPPKASITITPEYIKANKLQDDCLMAVVHDYPDGLCKRLYLIALPNEKNTLSNLFNQQELHCEIDGNANLIIKN